MSLISLSSRQWRGSRLVSHIGSVVWFGFFAALTGLLSLLIVRSLSWRMIGDVPFMTYVAFLMREYHFVPYRDLFEINMPGAYLVHVLFAQIVGYGDLGARLIDLGLLAILLVVSGFWLAQFGGRAMWSGIVVFALLYLGHGPMVSLEREFIVLIPIGLALALLAGGPRWRGSLGWFSVSLLFGIVATIKPHAIIGLPAVLFVLFLDERGRGIDWPRAYRLGWSVLLGGALPLIAMIGYLVLTGALGPFLDIAGRYWSLYSQLSGQHAMLDEHERPAYLMANFLKLGGHQVWLLAAVSGAIVGLRVSRDKPRLRQHVWLIIVITALYSFYPVFAGKFWPYHYLPFLYPLILLSSICFSSQPLSSALTYRVFPVVTTCLIIGTQAISPVLEQFREQTWLHERHGRIDTVAAFLVANARMGDKVQPLEWIASGSAQSLLIARAELATPFLDDVHFYHHVNTDYVQRLRRRFMDRLHAEPPRYIIDYDFREWPTGRDTSREFPELRQFLSERYTIVVTDATYGVRIHERRASQSLAWPVAGPAFSLRD